MIKGKYVRNQFFRKLENNLREGIKKYLKKDEFVFQRKYDRFEFSSSVEIQKENIITILTSTPGAQFIQEVQTFPLGSFEEIFQAIKPIIGYQVENKRFRVSVKRNGNHEFTSIELEKYLGGGLREHCGGNVSLKDYDINIKLEVRQDEFSLVTARHEGVSGYPIHAEGKVLSLVSGGYDSGVSSFMMMRNGCPTDFLFFNLGGYDHEQGVKEACQYMTHTLASGYNPKFISIDFTPVMQSLLEDCEPRYRTIILKRYMMRVAEAIATKKKYRAIVTGESLAQVSSQTMINLKHIESVLEDVPLYRPLLGLTKQEIMDYARKIGTDVYAESMPEFCGMISVNPATAPRKSQIEEAESRMKDDLVQQCLKSLEVIDFEDYIHDMRVDILEVQEIDKTDIILDLRPLEKQQEKKLPYPEDQVWSLPFYEVMNSLSTFDKNKRYVLTCSKGILSKSYAQMLWKSGIENVAIMRGKEVV